MQVLLCSCLILQAAMFAQESAEVHLNRATAYQERRDYTHSVPELRRALELNPDLAQAHAMLGEALLAQGFAAEALPHLERGGMLYLHALALLETNRLPEAIRELVQVQARRPNDADVLFYLGRAAGAMSQQSFNRLVRQYPDSARTYELQAQNLLGPGRGDLAEPLFRQALERQADLPGVHLARGRIRMELVRASCRSPPRLPAVPNSYRASIGSAASAPSFKSSYRKRRGPQSRLADPTPTAAALPIGH